MCHDFAQFRDSARRLKPRLGVILGSGLGYLTQTLDLVAAISYAQMPGLAAPTVEGHQGRLLLVQWIGRPVLVFAGRVHSYEGQPWRRVVEPVHVAQRLGVEILLLTNAAGGIRADLGPGSLMALEGHLDCTGTIPWVRQTSPYSRRLLTWLDQAARERDITLARGIYAQVTGPCYETPAEVRFLRAAGADAVGMSTAREAAAAAQLGLHCAAISCITNRAAGLGDGPITHDEVLANSQTAQDQLPRLIEGLIRRGSGEISQF